MPLHTILFIFQWLYAFLSQVVPLALGFYFTLQGNVVSVAKLIAMYIASNQLVNPIQTIMYNVASIQGSKPLADKIFSILNEEEMEGTAVSKATVANIEQLVVADVTKSYGSKTLFSQLSFTCKMGDKVLIREPVDLASQPYLESSLNLTVLTMEKFLLRQEMA